uniref:Uncharacterized protein n=1 Tax=Anguilla anguilla TaxID=7936 RepID=A0A0E9T3P0_ANGAN
MKQITFTRYSSVPMLIMFQANLARS